MSGAPRRVLEASEEHIVQRVALALEALNQDFAQRFQCERNGEVKAVEDDDDAEQGLAGNEEAPGGSDVVWKRQQTSSSNVSTSMASQYSAAL